MWNKKNHGGEPTKNKDKKYAIFVGILIAIPLAIIGHFLGRDDLAPIGATVGAGTAFASRIQKEKTSK